jgi:hypothetical protein
MRWVYGGKTWGAAVLSLALFCAAGILSAQTFSALAENDAPWLYPRPKMPRTWDGETYRIRVGVKGAMSIPTLIATDPLKALGVLEYPQSVDSELMGGLLFFVPIRKHVALQLETLYELPGKSTWVYPNDQTLIFGKTDGDSTNGAMLTVPFLLLVPFHFADTYFHPYGGGYISIPLEEMHYSIWDADGTKMTSGAMTINPPFGWTVGLKLGILHRRYSFFVDIRYCQDFTPLSSTNGLLETGAGDLYNRNMVTVALGVDMGLIRRWVKHPSPPHQ